MGKAGGIGASGRWYGGASEQPVNSPKAPTAADQDIAKIRASVLRDPLDGGIARTMRRLHDGDDMGPVWQTIIFIGGIIPALLGVTGIIMWLRTRTWRANAKAKRAAA